MANRALVVGGVAAAGAAVVGGAYYLTKKAQAQPSAPPSPAPTPAGCNWTPTTANAAANAIAVNISYHNQPIAWQDGATYGPVTIAGQQYQFVMGSSDGQTRDVEVQVCS